MCGLPGSVELYQPAQLLLEDDLLLEVGVSQLHHVLALPGTGVSVAACAAKEGVITPLILLMAEKGG